MKSTLINNGTIVTATDTFDADIFIDDEKIQSIGRQLQVNAHNVIDARGSYIFPGGVDAHTHLDLPFMGTFSSDNFETGTAAALCGGTTSIIDFAFQARGESLMAGLSTWHEKAAGKALCDYAFHLAVTDINESTKKEIRPLIEKEGVTSFKAFMAYKGAIMIDDRQLIDLMTEAQAWGGLVSVHAENGDLVDALICTNRKLGNLTPKYHALSRPEIAEEEATGRAMDLAYSGGYRLYIVHMTSAAALNRVREATKRNQKVWVETCVQYLLLDQSLYESPGFEGAKWVMSPPLRSQDSRDALWRGIEQGLVQVVATDHCPFTMKQKEMGKNDFSKIPNGAPGIENRMELMYSEGVAKKRISLNRFVDINCTAPAKIFGLYPRKGAIAVGSDADLVIFDPRAKHTISAKTHRMNCDYSAYEGWKVTGKTTDVLLRGELVVEDGKLIARKGFGKFLQRKPFGEI